MFKCFLKHVEKLIFYFSPANHAFYKSPWFQIIRRGYNALSGGTDDGVGGPWDGLMNRDPWYYFFSDFICCFKEVTFVLLSIFLA